MNTNEGGNSKAPDPIPESNPNPALRRFSRAGVVDDMSDDFDDLSMTEGNVSIVVCFWNMRRRCARMSVTRKCKCTHPHGQAGAGRHKPAGRT